MIFRVPVPCDNLFSSFFRPMDAKRARIGDKRSEGSRFGATFYDVACASLVMELILLALIGEKLPFSAGPGMPYNEDGIFDPLRDVVRLAGTSRVVRHAVTSALGLPSIRRLFDWIATPRPGTRIVSPIWQSSPSGGRRNGASVSGFRPNGSPGIRLACDCGADDLDVRLSPAGTMVELLAMVGKLKRETEIMVPAVRTAFWSRWAG